MIISGKLCHLYMLFMCYLLLQTCFCNQHCVCIRHTWYPLLQLCELLNHADLMHHPTLLAIGLADCIASLLCTQRALPTVAAAAGVADGCSTDHDSPDSCHMICCFHLSAWTNVYLIFFHIHYQLAHRTWSGIRLCVCVRLSVVLHITVKMPRLTTKCTLC